MSRSLSGNLDALIQGGHYKVITVLDITLGDGTVLHFGTGRVTVGSTTYLPKLHRTDGLTMGLLAENDRASFKVQNLDKAFGQTMTGQANVMDGAQAILGVVFIDQDSGAAYYDAKIPGELSSAPVDREKAEVTFLSSIDAVDEITTPTIGEMFPFSDPLPPEQRTNPNDNNPGGAGGGGDVDPDNGPRRYGPIVPVDGF